MKFRNDNTDGENQDRYTGSDAEINRYMKELDSLKQGQGAVEKLIGCGRSAIEPLRWFLLTGGTRGFEKQMGVVASASSRI